jgi:proteic killer suppression protein
MQIRFGSEVLATTCNDVSSIERRWGREKGRCLCRRLVQFSALPNLHLVAAIPGVLSLPVRPNRTGELVATVLTSLRIRFKIDHDPMPLLKDGSAKCKEIRKIVILEVIDGED